MKCPRCGRDNPETAAWCECGREIRHKPKPSRRDEADAGARRPGLPDATAQQIVALGILLVTLVAGAAGWLYFWVLSHHT